MNNFFLIFGVIIIAAGFQGFLKGSKASLIAAGILGGLVIAGTLVGGTLGTVLALVGSLGIAGKFVPGFMKAKDKGAALWPAGVLSVLSLVALVILVRALTGI
jgi:hypothetical protein